MTPVPPGRTPNGPRAPLGRQQVAAAVAPVADTADQPAPVPPPPHRHTSRLLVAAVAVLGVALTAVLAFRWGAADGASDAVPTGQPATTAAESGPTSLAPAAVYQQILPSFVALRTGAGAVGAGVVVTADGLVLTAASAVTDADGAALAGIELTFADGTAATATVAGVDDSIGIAVLEPSAFPELLVPAVLGAPGAVGDPVTVVGNPLDLTASLTAGVVSNLDRSTVTSSGAELTGLIQFDAAVGAGSVGGPLLNDRAEVIGVVVGAAPATTGDDGVSTLGFAVPIAVAVTAGGENLPR